MVLNSQNDNGKALSANLFLRAIDVRYSFTYDALGNKLRKTVTDKTTAPYKVTRTDYIGGFVYHNDTLEFLSTEEGRITYIPPQESQPSAWAYDYFEKDHLSNIRMVLTEQTRQDAYAATMEDGAAALENAPFDNTIFNITYVT